MVRRGCAAQRLRYRAAFLDLAFFLAGMSSFGAAFFFTGGAFPLVGAVPILDFFSPDWAFPFRGAFPLLDFAVALEFFLAFGDFTEVTSGVLPKQLVHRPTDRILA